MDNQTGRPRLPPNVRLVDSDETQLNLTNEECQELIAALSISISRYRDMFDVSVPPSTTEDEAEEEEQEDEFAYVEYLDDPCTCAWATEDGDISISIDGTFDAESMCSLGRHLLDLSSRLERPFSADAIHHWFELSYAQYLTIPRSALQSMPDEWQSEFVALLEELDETIDWRPKEGRYWVQLKDKRGRYVADPLMDYERGRRRLDHKKG